MYAQILGASFRELAPILQRIHDERARKYYCGRCQVMSGSTPIARCLSWLAGLPASHPDIEVTIQIERTSTGEIWCRCFGQHPMKSVLRHSEGLLHERLGPIAFLFTLSGERDHILWSLREARLFGWLPLPRVWFKVCEAYEAAIDGRYCFDVRAVLRGVGTLVHYRGWLVEHAE
jgi:hypothetical protein